MSRTTKPFYGETSKEARDNAQKYIVDNKLIGLAHPHSVNYVFNPDVQKWQYRCIVEVTR